MHPVPAFLDDTVEFFDPRLPAVIEFAGGARAKAARHRSEDQGLESRRVVRVERTVDEDIVWRTGFAQAFRLAITASTAARMTLGSVPPFLG